MSDPTLPTIHASNLARQFSEEHRTEFTAAMITPRISDRCFFIKEGDFDEWLVRKGLLDSVAGEYESNTVVRRGIVLRRNEIRRDINAYALKAEGYDRYQILPAKNGQMEVRLVAKFAQDAPHEIARRVEVTAKHHGRVVDKTTAIINADDTVRAQDRMAVAVLGTVIKPLMQAFADGVGAALNIVKGVEPPVEEPPAMPPRRQKPQAKAKKASTQRRHRSPL